MKKTRSRSIPQSTKQPTSQLATQASKILQEEKQSPATKQNSSSNLSFIHVSRLVPVLVFAEVVRHAINQISTYHDGIIDLSDKISVGINPRDAQGIIDYINLLINLKELILKLVSWAAVTASIIYCELENDNAPGELIPHIPNILDYLAVTSKAMDSLLTMVPQEPVLGITLTPDQKQFSETKSMISKVTFRLEEIQRENREAEEDWGLVEQNAYERMLEGSDQNVPVEEFLDWLSELKQGKDV